MNAKEMFRNRINEEERSEEPIKVTEAPGDRLIKRECSHPECSELFKCRKSHRLGGIDT